MGEDGLTLHGDINVLPAGSFRWCRGERILDNVGGRGERQLRTQKSPEGGPEPVENIPLQVSGARSPPAPQHPNAHV